MARKDRLKHAMEAMNGAFAVPAILTAHSAKIPAPMATHVLDVVIVLNIALRCGSPSGSIRWLNSATSQLSKTLQRTVPQTPPRMRPKKRT